MEKQFFECDNPYCKHQIEASLPVADQIDNTPCPNCRKGRMIWKGPAEEIYRERTYRDPGKE